MSPQPMSFTTPSPLTHPRENSTSGERNTHLAVKVLEVAGVLQKQQKTTTS